MTVADDLVAEGGEVSGFGPVDGGDQIALEEVGSGREGDGILDSFAEGGGVGFEQGEGFADCVGR